MRNLLCNCSVATECAVCNVLCAMCDFAAVLLQTDPISLTHFPYPRYICLDAPPEVAQLLELWGGEGVFDKLLKVYNSTSVGAVMIGGSAPNTTCQNSPACRIGVQNQLQLQLYEHSRLGIPVTFTQETMTSGAHNGTSFPHPVSQGSSWNMSLVHQIAKAVAKEAYYSGVDRGYSPVLQVTTDPRFGRWHENFGGDGLLVASCATAAVTGLQGACAKVGIIDAVQLCLTVNEQTDIAYVHALSYCSTITEDNFAPPTTNHSIIFLVFSKR